MSTFTSRLHFATPALCAGVLVSFTASPALAQFQHPSPLPDVLLVNDSFGKTNPAQGPYDLFEDQIFRLADFDGDGLYESELETSLLFEFGLSPNFNKSWQILEVRSRLEGGQPAIYFTNNRDGNMGSSGNYVAEVWRGVDLNGDAFIDESELTMVGDMEAVIGGGQGAEGIALTKQGSVWASTDYPGGGLVKFANGTATVYVDDEDGPYQVPGKFGSPVTIDTDDFTTCSPWGDDGVLVYSDGYQSQKDEAVHRFVDLNGDGDILDPGEAVCFFNATGANPALTRNPDFGSNLRSMVINGATDSYCWLKEMAQMTEPALTKDGEEIDSYFFASNSSNSGNFGINENGQFVNGVIYRAVDVNDNGHVNDSGEVNLYYDGSGDSGGIEQLDKILGIDAYGQSLLVFFLKGGGKSVCILTDLNGDGDAMDQGERIDAWDEVNLQTVPFNLFFFGIALGAMEPGILPEPITRQATFLGGGCAPSGGQVPRLSAQGEARVGTTYCEVQVLDGPVGGFSWLFLSATDEYFGQDLPIDLVVSGLPGCILHTDLAFRWLVSNDANGEAVFPISAGLANPGLAGADLTFQAVTVGDLGSGLPTLSLTNGMTLSIPE